VEGNDVAFTFGEAESDDVAFTFGEAEGDGGQQSQKGGALQLQFGLELREVGSPGKDKNSVFKKLPPLVVLHMQHSSPSSNPFD